MTEKLVRSREWIGGLLLKYSPVDREPKYAMQNMGQRIEELEVKLDALTDGAEMYLEFFKKCLEDPQHNKEYGATTTNVIANKFARALGK
jgi:hypothetical protein